MANTFTPPVWVKAKPHASAEKQVGDSDPSGRTDVINRVEKGILANLKKLINTIMDGATFDFTDLATVAALANRGITPQGVSGTPAQHGLYQENVVKAWAHVTLATGTPSVTDSYNVTGIADGGVGVYTLTWDRDFANATYAVGGIPVETGNAYLCGTALAVGTFAYEVQLNDGTPSDKNHTVIAIGDQ